MKRHLIFVVLLISITAYAQTADREKEESDSISQAKLAGETYFEKKGYKGEQFFNKVWMQSDILLSTGKMVLGEKVKYNGLLDELIWANATINQQFKLDKPLISEFWLKDEKGMTTHFKQITLNKSPSASQQSDFFAEVAVEGKLALYIQRKISIVDKDNVTIDGILRRQETIRATPLYYLKLSSDNYLQLDKIKLKSFIQLFPTKKKLVDKLMKNNNFKLKTEKDLIRLIKLLNDQETLASPNTQNS